jgi:CDP-diacylglycerol--glycerol-3-phosphate 3-phosphatidyltransferase
MKPEVNIKKAPKVLSDRLRVVFKGLFEPIAVFLNRLGVRPNHITFLGLLGHILGAYLLAIGHITWGGIVILVIAPLDFLDGTLARLRGEPTKFGAFVDSVTDRYDEAFIFGGLLYYFLTQQNWIASLLVYISLSGSLLVSYVRSRAESLEFSAKIGILSRFERYVVLVPALIFNYPVIALWILAILTNFTAVQRIIHVRRQAYVLQESQDGS